ncbi:AIR synthase related protein, partial [Methylophilaceae bacterium]|nr:AIR synthase related protein [Methylophilaceae bacterium]
MLKEFSLINKYFNQKSSTAPLGIGDDGALLEKNSQNYYVLSQDTLNVDSHFLRDTNIKYLGWKTLAVNVSDILAMGGNPKFALLSISTEEANDSWLKKFSSGLFDCANQ